MSRFRKLSHTLWHRQYHIVWVPKYRYKILDGEIKAFVKKCINAFAQQSACEIVELNVQIDHIHLLIMVPPKISISKLVGILKGRTAIRIFNHFKKLKLKRYWGNHFWAPGYCVDTVGLDSEMIRKYVKYQENTEKEQERENEDPVKQ